MSSLEQVLDNYKKKGYELSLDREIKSGKEATVFAVAYKDTILALKIYADPKIRSFQNTGIYLEGRHFRSQSEKKAVIKRNRKGIATIHQSWIGREFYLLKKLHDKGVHVPQVIEWTTSSILMEFMGNGETPAPRLIDIELSAGRAKETLTILMEDIQKMLKIGIVHSDLSPYNILYWNKTPYIIDIPQAIDIRTNPNKGELLKRDVTNLLEYFKKFIPINEKDLFFERLDTTK